VAATAQVMNADERLMAIHDLATARLRNMGRDQWLNASRDLEQIQQLARCQKETSPGVKHCVHPWEHNGPCQTC
jgi:putative SOS response-associated peptidase YedK